VRTAVGARIRIWAREQNHAIGRSCPLDSLSMFVGEIVALSSEYHRRRATILTQLAQSTRNLDAAKALLRMAAEHVVHVKNGRSFSCR
jgi:hypothetical protein